jgi:hypothetical protein
MFRISRIVPALVLTAISLLSAAPKIEADKTTFDCSAVTEGKSDKINASFTIKNTGDSTLKIDNVRPGCGCTVVKFDTIVPAGKSSVILSTVNIANFHSGPLSKYITVLSNASNKPSLQLTITATINPIIEISEQYVTLMAGKSHALYVSCAKKDLHITSVELTLPPSSSAISSWQSNAPMPIPFKWTALDSVRKDGFRVYELELTAPAVTDRVSGQLMMRTDHQDKRELSSQATIEKRP